MARFQVDVEKRLGSEFWTNVWQIEAPALANATLVADQIVAAEQLLHNTQVTFTRYRISTVAMNDDVYVIVPIGETGAVVDAGLLPLFNTLRMDFTAPTGRPSRKYFRGVLTEGNINGDAVTTSAFVSASQAIFDTFAQSVEDAGVVDPQGAFFTGIVIHPFVQMRQLRRSRRRRTNGNGVFQ